MAQNEAKPCSFRRFALHNFVYQAVSTTRGHLRCKFLLKGRKNFVVCWFKFCRCKSGAERQIFRPVKMPVYNANRRFSMCGNFCTVWHKMKQNRAVFGVLRYIILFIRQFQRQGGICVANFCSKGVKISSCAGLSFAVVKAVQNVKFSALSKCPFTTLLTCGTILVQV